MAGRVERIRGAVARDSSRPTTMSGAPSRRYRDDLEAQIDEFLGGLWALIRDHIRGLIILFLLGSMFYLFIWPTRDSWGSYVALMLFFMMQIAFAITFMIVQFGALFWFLGRGRTYWVKPGETGVTFQDYKGNPEVLESARRIVTLLRGVQEFKEMGGEAIRGLLLVGPPGTGKSYLAQAISSEAGVPFGYASAPSFSNMFMGISNLRVMMLYRKARKLGRRYGACILFIDEIDAIGGTRGGTRSGPVGMMGGMFGMGGSGMLNELLLQMDPPPQEIKLFARILRSLGLRKRKVELPPVLTMAATNLPDVLDPALLRPGRFDRKIVVDRPSAEGRREILEYYLAKVKHDPELPMDYMVYDTIGYTPVAIRYVINEAVIHAHFDGRTEMNYVDFTAARETHEMGLKQPIVGISYEERRRLAYHEAGHAVAGFILRPKDRTVKVTIVRHGSALGFAAYKPKEETHTETREELLADIQVSLAARAAEEMFLGIQMSGVTGDLQQATMRATAMVNAYGMLGTLYSTLTFGQFVPDAVSRRKVERILNYCFEAVHELLAANRDAVVAVAEALLVQDELNEEQLREIMQHYTIVIPEMRPEPLWTDEDERKALSESALFTPAMPIPEAVAAGGDGG